MSILSNIKEHIAHRKNYGSSRSLSKIKYIVIHYTSNDGDTDENNGKYFANTVTQTSAHYFVDDDSITQSVPDNYVAWHCGGNKYPYSSGGSLHGKCTNTNSIGIEICDDVKNGVVYPSDKTIQNVLELTEHLMKKYNVPKDNVIRHYDVTGKACPAYWTSDAKWKSEFWNKIGGCGKVQTTSEFKSYLVKVTTETLNVRDGAGVNYPIKTTVKKNQVYTIVEEKNGWGKLKSGVGWVHLGYTKKV